MDLKAFSETFYRKICSGALAPVLETLEYIYHETDTWLEITTLLIPGENDSTEELERLTDWVATHLGPDVPLHFTAFHPDWKMLDHPPTSLSTLRRARNIALKQGLRYVYTGNFRDPEGQSTYCHHCGHLLIGRNGYTITAWHLDETGHCPTCGTPCAGVFEARPGTWGPRRQPVWMQAFSG